ncbi:MAG: hypothetical protein QXF01_01565 [Candidatus Micrarchaeaceae archaeon]
MRVSIQKVSVDQNGGIMGLDGILSAALQLSAGGLGFEDANSLCTDIGRLARELLELGWVCKSFAEAGEHFGYEMEVCIDEKSVRVIQVYRIPPPPPGATHSSCHGAATARRLPKVAKVS